MGLLHRNISTPKAPHRAVAPPHAGAAGRNGTAKEMPGAGDEAAWSAALRRGDREAFARLVETHQAAVFGYLRARLTEPSDAEDLCQEVFVRAYLGRSRLPPAPELLPWMLGIARNTLREHLRRVKRRKETAWTELCLHLEELVDPPHGETHAALEHLPACLGALGQSARQAIDLRYTAGMRLSEIGVKLRRSEGAVKLLMYRARQALRYCLESKLSAERS